MAVSDPERLTRKIRAALAPCSLGQWPTPLEPAPPPLARALGLEALWVKRDDRSSPRYGGNKARGLAILLVGAPAGSVFVTVAGTGSTHCLATAVHAAAPSCRASRAPLLVADCWRSLRLARRARRLLARVDVPLPAPRAPELVNALGRGYGWPTVAGESARRLAAPHGLILDPTYGAKAFAFFLQRGTGNERRVVFWHTFAMPAPLPESAR